MKAIILAGGHGTRLSEETEFKPKPMVLIDDKPILWHIMNIFSSQGFNEFVIALGYKGEMISEWLNDLGDEKTLRTDQVHGQTVLEIKQSRLPAWHVTALETGLHTQTGGRVGRCLDVCSGERVIATYGDGLANVPIKELLKFHSSHGKLATVTAVRPPARFGHLNIEGDRVTHFGEKRQSDEGWINGGFFVLEPGVREFIGSDEEAFETGALPQLAEMGELMAYHHYDFWQPMDTLRERNDLAILAKESPPPWLKGARFH